MMRLCDVQLALPFIPIAGVTMAELVATAKVPELIAPFRLDRFRDDRAVSERASAGTH